MTTVLDNGVPREMTPEEEAEHLAAITPSLEERRSRLVAAVDQLRDARIAGGFGHQVGGVDYVFQSRQSDRENILGLAIAAQMALAQDAQAGDLQWLTPGQDFLYITADNTLAPMDAFDVLGLYQRGLSFKAAQTFHARALKDAAIAAADEGELAAIPLETGWPT